MAEVPEHLLQRSASRRAALTGGGDAGDASAAPATTGEASPAAAAPAAAAPAKVVPTQPAFKEPVDKVAYQKVAAIKKRRVPAWAMGVLACLPLWGLLYIGAFGARPSHNEEAVDGGALYGSNCAACHGANGQGGAGPELRNGETAKTFPGDDGLAAQISWIETGSGPFKGKPYGDPNREGGQRIANSGNMPAFAGTLTPEEIEAIAIYERESL
ncbi:MAG: cytochrome c [Acidimicrobiales bacterium]|nr:cytochrome c [Acidimicrobiales bacterium]